MISPRSFCFFDNKNWYENSTNPWKIRVVDLNISLKLIDKNFSHINKRWVQIRPEVAKKNQ